MGDHRETHEKVAIKKIIDVFRSAGDARYRHPLLGGTDALQSSHTLREIRLLKHFKHPHVRSIDPSPLPLRPLTPRRSST